MEKEDIVTFEDVKCFVNAFYSSVRQDPMLSEIFNERIQEAQEAKWRGQKMAQVFVSKIIMAGNLTLYSIYKK
jgi:truncated hemoglobin YjbI